jgi:hypothetical protein
LILARGEILIPTFSRRREKGTIHGAPETLSRLRERVM